MQIDPLSTLPLVYQLTDPADAGTYYVRAVLRDSLTGTTIQTKNLSSSGSGRFKSSIVAPQDPSGAGRHVDVTISVYTDAGYTTYSDVYARQLDKYLIKKTVPNFGGGGSGADVDYTKIGKLIEESVIKHKVVVPKIDLSNLQNDVAEVGRLVKGIDIPAPSEQKETDLTPAIDAIQALETSVSKKIGNIDIPEPIDHSDAISRLGNLIDEMSNIIRQNSSDFKTYQNDSLDKFKKDVGNIVGEKIGDKISESIKAITDDAPNGVMVVGPEQSATPEPVQNPRLSPYFP